MSSAHCLHEVSFGGLCVACGCDISALEAETGAGAHHQRPGSLTACKDLQVQGNALSKMEAEERERRVKARKFVLVLDIDHTLLVTSAGQMQQQRFQVHRIVVDGYPLDVRLRPYLDEFLSEANAMADLYLYTHAAQAYAEAVVNLIDPTGDYFGRPPRLFSRQNTEPSAKRLSEIFGFDTSLVVVIDDRDEVWENKLERHNHLYKVLPYTFVMDEMRGWISLEGLLRRLYLSKDSGLFKRSLPVRVQTDDDVQLQFVLRNLRRVHSALFDSADATRGRLPVASDVLPALRSATLQGCVILFLGLLDQGASMQPEHMPFLPFVSWWCESLGAEVESEVSQRTTHVIAAHANSAKIDQLKESIGQGREIHIVTYHWLLAAIATWTRPTESLFGIGDSPQSVSDIWQCLGLPEKAPGCNAVDGLAHDVEADLLEDLQDVASA